MWESKRKICLKIVLYIILAICTIPVLVATFYAVPAADDFTNTLSYQSYQGNIIGYLLKFVLDLYKGWQGTYFGVFLCGIPTYYLWGIWAIRLEMLLNAIIFFSTLAVCVNTMLDSLEIPQNVDSVVKLSFVTMTVFYIINMGNVGESFYWITGLCVYTVPLSCAFLCITAYLKYMTKNKSRKWLIAGIMFAFCGVGGALDISAFLCAILLLCIIYDYLVKGKIETNVWIGLTAFIGSLINTLAPGNYARHGAIDTEIRFTEMIIDTFTRVNYILKNDLKFGILPLIIIIGVMIIYNKLIDCKFVFKYPVLVTLYCYIGIYLTIFPVALGYSSAAKFPDRCLFIERVSTIFFVLIATVYWSGWLAKKNIFKLGTKKIIIIVLICIVTLFVFVRNNAYKSFTAYRMIEHLINGDYREECEVQESILEQIVNSEEDDVIVYIRAPKEGAWTNLKKIGLSEDEDWWVNDGLAMYYNKKSIVLQNISDLYEQ